MTTVVNLRVEPYDVFIGRPSLFGNPARPGGRRGSAIEKYRTYFYERLSLDEAFKSEVWKLKGKRLGCFCKPLPCHGDIIAEYLEADHGSFR